MFAAPTFETTYGGTGDDVVQFAGTGNALALTHDGESNFAVYAYGEGTDLLVNEIGPPFPPSDDDPIANAVYLAWADTSDLPGWSLLNPDNMITDEDAIEDDLTIRVHDDIRQTSAAMLDLAPVAQAIVRTTNGVKTESVARLSGLRPKLMVRRPRRSRSWCGSSRSPTRPVVWTLCCGVSATTTLKNSY